MRLRGIAVIAGMGMGTAIMNAASLAKIKAGGFYLLTCLLVLHHHGAKFYAGCTNPVATSSKRGGDSRAARAQAPESSKFH